MNNNLANNLKKIRKDHNISQEQLAEELKVSRQAISKWESGNTYPEMDKLLQICERFNLNINDLLHNDIREVSSEEESRRNLNMYIDNFLDFITRTIRMFSSFNFKTKIRCLMEQAFVAIFLFLAFGLAGAVFNSLFANLISFIPEQARYVITGLMQDFFYIVSIILGFIIWLHVFKTRYLDYYQKTEPQGEESETETVPETAPARNSRTKERIVLRDPEHSEYRFLNGLLKIIVAFIKISALGIALFGCFAIIGLVGGIVSSFMITGTGLFFIGVLLALLGATAIAVVIELILLNFVFNRKSNKKILIWSFIGSLLLTGAGSGLAFIGSLDFEITRGDELYSMKKLEIDMKNNLVIDDMFGSQILFVEKDIKNVVIEYSSNKYVTAEYDFQNSSTFSQLSIFATHEESFKLIKETINHLNDMKILQPDTRIRDIKVYASKENLAILKNNLKTLEEHNSYLIEKESNIQDLESRIAEQESQISELNSLLEQYR